MNFKKTITKSSACVISLIFVVACAIQPSKNSLYERLGGNDGLVVIVDATIEQVIKDPKTKRSFEGVKIKPLKESIVSQLCELSGGPCRYEGESMKNAHYDLNITEAEWELMVEALRNSLNRHVGSREKNELLKILAPMKKQIVHSYLK